MRFINPSVEYWEQPKGEEGIWSQIARATRVCYQSQAREGESDMDFVERVIFKPAQEGKTYNFNKMHGAMLEHGTVYLTIENPQYYRSTEYYCSIANNGYKDNIGKALIILEDDKYTKIQVEPEERASPCFEYISTNMRVLVEHNLLYMLQFITKPTDYHIKRYTFNVITDIGVTREMNRHRTFSVAEQSTRYCDFNKDKFGGELTFVLPKWVEPFETEMTDDVLLAGYGETINSYGLDDKGCFKDATDLDTTDCYIYSCLVAQYTYNKLRKLGWKPEQARQVLPLGLKTQAVYTAFEDDWRHFLALRADNVSGKVHPNMAIIANMIKDKFKEITHEGD